MFQLLSIKWKEEALDCFVLHLCLMPIAFFFSSEMFPATELNTKLPSTIKR